jgi:hypothetical protein
MAIAVIADVHPEAAVGTVPIPNVEFPEGEVGILRPLMSHETHLRDVTSATVHASIRKLVKRLREELVGF